MQADKVSDSDCSESDWSTDEEKSLPQMKRAKNEPNTLDGTSCTEFSSLLPHVVSELCPVGDSTVQTFLWQNAKGVNEFMEALLKLDEKNMKRRAFANDEKR